MAITKPLAQLATFRLRTLLLVVAAAGVIIALWIVPPIGRSDLIGTWRFSGDPLASHRNHGYQLSFYFEPDDRYSYFVRTQTERPLQVPTHRGWELRPVKPLLGRYILSLSTGDEWPVRFSRDHKTMYVELWGDEQPIVKVNE